MILVRIRLTVLALFVAALLTACGNGGGDDAATTTTTTSSPGADERPASWVGIDDTGRLVVVNQDGDTDRVLGEFDHPEECPEGDEPVAGCNWVVELAMGPDGDDVYYETCCEPAPGTIFRVSVEGGEPEMVVHGAHPAIDPSGERLAVVELQWVTVHPLGGGEETRFESERGLPALHGMAWSPDGERVAFTVFDEQGEPGRLQVLDVNLAQSLDDARELPLDGASGSAWTLPSFRADGLLVAIEQEFTPPEGPSGDARGLVLDPEDGTLVEEFAPEGPVLSQHHDSSGTHLIYVVSDGSVRWRSAEGDGGVLAQNGYLAAAW